MRHRQPADQASEDHPESWSCHSKECLSTRQVLDLASQLSHHHRIVADDCFFFSSTMTRLRKAEVEQGCGRAKPYIPDFE
jgi:hypothetical protein